MAIRYALINDADNAWISGPVDDEPTPADGQHVVQVPMGYPQVCAWSPLNGGGFVDIVTATPLITVGRFKLLFTQAERIALRQAAQTNTRVEDFLDLLNGFTDGVSLSDPVLIAAVNNMATDGLLSTDRAATILAGTPPA